MNIGLWSVGAERYDALRPQPPATLLDLLTQLAGGAKPRLVVDLGSGTGLSTRVWAGRAEQVVGIESNDDMRRQAEAATAGLFSDRQRRCRRPGTSQSGSRRLA